MRPGRKTQDKQRQRQMCQIRSWEQKRTMTNSSSKDILRCCVSIKCRKLPAKMATKKRRWKKFEDLRYAFYLPVICYTFQNPVNIFKDILTVSLAFILLGEKEIWHTRWSIMVTAKQRGFSNSLVLCCFPSVFPGCVAVVVVGCCYFSLYIFSLFLFFIELNYSYCSWTVELKNHLLSCIFTWHLIHAQLFINAMLFRLGSEIFTKERKQFHLLKIHKGRIIKRLQCQLFSSIY